MNLLFVNPEMPNPQTGASHLNLALIRELMRKNVRVTQIASSNTPLVNRNMKNGFQIIKCRGIPTSQMPRLKSYLFGISSLEVVFRILRAQSFDLINSWDVVGLPLMYYQKLRRLKGNPPHLVCTHDTSRMLYTAYNEQIRRIPRGLYEYIKLNEALFVLDNKIREKMEKKVYRKADHLIVFCSFAKEALHEEYGIPYEKISVVPLGVDIDTFAPKFDSSHLKKKFGMDQEFVTLTVATTSWRKGMVFLLRAFHALSLTEMNFKAIIATGGSSNIRDLVNELNLNRRVIMIEKPLNHEELAALYNLADIFILPSVEEGFGLTPLESMACGTPVLVSAVGGFVDIIDNDCGVLVPPFDYRSLVSHLQELYEDRSLLKEMGKKARMKALKYTWEITGEKYSRICREIARC